MTLSRPIRRLSEMPSENGHPRYHHGHVAGRFVEPPGFFGRCAAYREAELAGADSGSSHTHLVVAELDSGGYVDSHRHSHEEAFYVLDGEPELLSGDGAIPLGQGGFGLVDVGEIHGWRNSGDRPARWLSVNAPLPLASDPYFDVDADSALETAPAVGAPRSAAFTSTRELNLAGYKPNDMTGVSVDFLVDEAFGADLLRLFVVAYAPGGSMGPHEHPVEEFYFVLEGEVFATADDLEVTLGVGDFLWTGVGCVHSFENRSDADVVWIETQAPQPPRDHTVRFISPMEAVTPRNSL
jgi:quercetin dioxygenase-like cupin family protein